MLAQKRGAKMSDVDAAVMAALVIAEEYFDACEKAENARSQIQSCVEDASRARSETAETQAGTCKVQK
jgi:cell division protein ZapA